jgi:uncharacterized protein
VTNVSAEDFFFTTTENRLAATRVTGPAPALTDVLALHGLGETSSRHGIRYLLGPLAAAGHGSVTFDFSGNGDSTGVMTAATLGGRVTETLAAASHLAADVRPVLIGTSMGAHLAATCVPQLRPRALALFCPAAYPGGSHRDPFDGTLARPGAYPDSPAYAGIAEFDGDLLLVATRRDQVIAPEVVAGYLEHAAKARSTQVVWIEDCDHFVHRWLPGQPRLLAEIVHRLLGVVSLDPSEATSQARPSTHRWR